MAQPDTPLISTVWTTDARGLCNSALEQTAGLLPPMENASFTEWMRSAHPEHGTLLADKVAGAMARREAFRHEHGVLCMDHQPRWVVTTGMPRFRDDGQYEGFSGALIDITEQKKALERALRSEAEYRLIVDNSMDLIAHCGVDGRYIHVSPSYTHVIGWEASEMIGRDVTDFLHPDDRARAHDGMVRIFNGADIPDVTEVRKRHRDGRYISLGTKVRKIADPATGRILGAVLVSRDITHEKEMLSRLERMAEQNAALIKNSPDLMLLLDLDAKIIHANKAVRQILGYQPEELIGQDAMGYVCLEARADAERALMTLKQGEGHLSSNFACLGKDGRSVQLDLSLYRPSGSELIYATARDVTEKHRTRLALDQAHAQVRTILESIEDGFFSVNTNWEITYANNLAAAFVGVDRDASIGRVLWDVATGLSESSVAQRYRHAMETRENTSFEVFYEPVGAWLSERVYAHEDGLSVFFHDISDRVNSDHLIHESERRFRQMIGLTPAGYVQMDACGFVQEVNPALCQLSGYSRDELIGANIFDILLAGPQDGALSLGRSKCQEHALDTVIRHKQGHKVYVLVNQTIERDDAGRPHSLTAFVTDITERKHAETRLEQLATTDALTGLPNRAWINQHLKAILGQVHRHSTTAVLFVDLNRFKQVNDSMGHATGDRLLQQVSQRLQSCMRPGDVVARLGGDEFVIAANCAGRDAAAAIAQRLIATLTIPFHVDGLEMCVGASIGISLSGHDVATPELLFQNADTAMYKAKAIGESAYQFFEPEMSADAKRRLKLEAAMRRALEAGQFELYYQPRVDLRSMRVHGMEALLRWNHPEFGQILPLEFIPIAEERGHIETIGNWVLREACRDGKRLGDEYGSTLHVSVNVSARQLRSANLIAEVEQALRKSGLPPDSLELELTESALIEDTEQSADILRRLKQMGVKLSLDDFGTGYSSLSYLKQFPVDVLKLDRSFFHERPFKASNEDFVKALVGMAHALGLMVVAEGIESQEVTQALSQAGCDEGQGYLFGKPMPLRQFGEYLQRELERTVPGSDANYG